MTSRRVVGVLAVSAALIFLFSLVGGAGASTQSSLTVSPTAGIVGSKITISGQGYPASTQLTIQWATVNASWLVTGNPPQVTGLSTVSIENDIATVQTGSGGAFSATVTVPSDYGGQHVLQAAFSNGTALTGKAIFNIEPSFHISPTSGPAGTPILVTATGLSYGAYSTSYYLYWDNSMVGYFTALSHSGATSFTFYASGTPGTHYIEIYQGYPGPGYLNPQQGPPSSETQSVFPPYIPFHAEFNITTPQSSGSPSAARAMEMTSLAAVAAVLLAGGFFVTRFEPRERRAIAKTIAAVIIILVVALAGVGAFAAYETSTSHATTTATSTSTSITTATTTATTTSTVTLATTVTATNTASSSGGSGSYTPVASAVRPAVTVPENTATTGPRISVSPEIASVGQTVTVTGAGFSPNTQVPLSWSTRSGNNLHGYQLVSKPLANVTSDSNGDFSLTMKVPADLGGLHFISSGTLTKNSNATLFLQRAASINATQGPDGTVVQITMLGVGWTFNTNIAALDYDNSYIGYGCGFNSGGNVTFYLTITGPPGINTIDIYPSVWWGTSNYYNQSIVEYRYPLLTPQDHPELMPSFHFSFLVTAPTDQPQNSPSLASSAALPGVAFLAIGTTFLGGNGPSERATSKEEVRT